MNIYIVQGEHYSIPGRLLSACATREEADVYATGIVNLLLTDLGLKQAKTWQEGLRRVQKSTGGNEADVWIEVRPLLGQEEPPVRNQRRKYHANKMNKDRRRWACSALETFGDETGQSLIHDERDMVGDLLGDLMHYCQQRGIDFDDRLRNGRMHFDAEFTGTED